MAELTTAVADALLRQQEFTTSGASAPPVVLRVDGEEYRCAGEVPSAVMETIASFAEAEGFERLKLIGAFLDGVMFDEDRQRYEARLRDKERPISIQEAAAHLKWLMEVYGVRRPSASPSSSPAG